MKGNPLSSLMMRLMPLHSTPLSTAGGNQRPRSNKYLDSIKNGATSSLYLQVTGTPQAILLQTLASGWHPYFTYYFQPGSSYLGGDFFFPSSQKPDCITFLETVKEDTKEAVYRHIAVSAQVLHQAEGSATHLFTQSVRQSAHSTYAKEVKKVLEWCKANNAEFKAGRIARHVSNLSPQKSDKQPDDVLISKAESLVANDEISVYIMNGTNEVDSSAYAQRR